ncbi:MAG: hypothetical protein QOF90_3753 [Acetobacteraceae bacterium]|nr:hypothetical protein [Acetobacteraceae bacterium]
MATVPAGRPALPLIAVRIADPVDMHLGRPEEEAADFAPNPVAVPVAAGTRRVMPFIATMRNPGMMVPALIIPALAARLPHMAAPQGAIFSNARHATRHPNTRREMPRPSDFPCRHSVTVSPCRHSVTVSPCRHSGNASMTLPALPRTHRRAPSGFTAIMLWRRRSPIRLVACAGCC